MGFTGWFSKIVTLRDLRAADIEDRASDSRRNFLLLVQTFSSCQSEQFFPMPNLAEPDHAADTDHPSKDRGILSTVNRYTHYVDELQHWQQRYHHRRPSEPPF